MCRFTTDRFAPTKEHLTHLNLRVSSHSSWNVILFFQKCRLSRFAAIHGSRIEIDVDISPKNPTVFNFDFVRRCILVARTIECIVHSLQYLSSTKISTEKCIYSIEHWIHQMKYAAISNTAASLILYLSSEATILSLMKSIFFFKMRRGGAT